MPKTAMATPVAPNGNSAGTPSKRIELPKIRIEHATIFIVGDSPLIVHNWSEKAKKQILDKQMKKAKQAKEPKDPEQDYLDSLYHLPEGGYGFPAIAFKSAAVDACSHIAGVTKVEARGAFHVMAELVKINGVPEPREDMVKIDKGSTADIRHRGEFKAWSCVLPIRYNANVLSLEQLLNLFETAGFAIGVGERRPQKDGSNGMFHVGREGER
jgi:hypothetical protein